MRVEKVGAVQLEQRNNDFCHRLSVSAFFFCEAFGMMLCLVNLEMKVIRSQEEAGFLRGEVGHDLTESVALNSHPSTAQLLGVLALFPHHTVKPACLPTFCVSQST